MKKYLLMAMAVLAALSLMVAGCGGKEEAFLRFINQV